MFCLGIRQTISRCGFRLHGSAQGKPRFPMGLHQFLRAPAAERKCRNRVERHIVPRQPAQRSGHPLMIRREPAQRVIISTDQILRFGLSSGVSDTHGMKAIRRDVVVEIAPRVQSTQDLFDTELVVRAERAGYRIVEVPALVEEKRATNARLMTRVPRTLRGVWSIRQILSRE